MLPKVHCVHDADIQAEYPRNMSGRITIVARGETFTRTVIVPKGEPANFLSETELRAKFAGLVESVLGADRTERLAQAVLALDTTAQISGLIRLSAPMLSARLAGE
jgi:2-methylcitrate dehydratase PrpD